MVCCRKHSKCSRGSLELRCGQNPGFYEKRDCLDDGHGGDDCLWLFGLGGYGYITSSGSADGLDKAKKTVYYSVIGLAISAGSFVLSNAVLEMAKQSFGN